MERTTVLSSVISTGILKCELEISSISPTPSLIREALCPHLTRASGSS